MNVFIKSLMIGVMTVSGTFGALFFKRGVAKTKGINISYLIVIPEIYIGGVFYLLGALLNIILLKYVQYTILYPMTSLTYIWTMIVSYVVLKERINKEKVLAVVFIILGIIILCISNN